MHMGARWNRFKQALKTRKKKAASERASEMPARKRFATIEEQREHLKLLNSERTGPWSIENVKKQLREQKKNVRIFKKTGNETMFKVDMVGSSFTEKGVNANIANTTIKFKRKELERALKEFGISKKEGPLVIGAGFTGKFARSFKSWLPWQREYKVAFTDINPEYVEMAKKGKTLTEGGRVRPARKIKNAYVEDMERPHTNASVARVSFEATPNINNLTNTISKNLEPKHGIIMFTSEYQSGLITEIKGVKEANVYGGLEVKEVKMKNNVTAIQVKLKPQYREQYLKDRDAFEASLKKTDWGTYHNEINIKQSAKRLGISEKEAEHRINRFQKAFGKFRY